MKTLAIYLTGACNLRCKHCSVGFDQYRPRQALSDDDIIRVLDRAREREVEFITFLGGEPFYSPHDLPRIFGHAEALGINVSVNTNLFFYERLEELFDYTSLQNIVVSVDGASAESHDAMRGKGSFERTVANLRKLVETRNALRPDITIDVTFALSDLNRRDNLKMFRLAEDIGIDCLNVNIVQPIGRAGKFRQRVMGDDAGYIEALAQIFIYFLARKPAFKLSVPIPPAVAAFINRKYAVPMEVFTNERMCGGTSVYTYVDLMGNLLPCPGLSYEEGRNSLMNRRQSRLSIVDHKISEIEESSLFQAFETARKTHSKNALFDPCNRCAFSDRCSPCTSAYYKTGADREISLCKRVSNLVAESGEQFSVFKQTDLSESF